MSGISSVLNIGRDALRTYELAMQVTSHNIANALTPGYTRQQIVLEAQSPMNFGGLQLGMGVVAGSVSQAFDQYTTRSIQQNTSALAENDAKATALSYLETIFNEASGQGLNQALTDFWNAWQDLSGNPGGIAERSALLQKAEALAVQFRSMSADLNRVGQSMNTSLGASILDLNQTARQIAALNDKIVAAETGGTAANDLRDQRNSLVEKMSSLIGISYYENEAGSLSITTTSGSMLVNGTQSWELSQVGEAIYWNGIPTDLSPELSGGKIGGWLEVRDEIVPQYLANLDELAGSLIREVNAVHTGGYALSGATGLDFFEPLANPAPGDFSGAAATIGLSAAVSGNPANIAAGGVSGSPGDNENALRILDLQTDAAIQIRKWTYAAGGTNVSSTLQTMTLEDYYRSLVGDMGVLAGGVAQDRDFAQTLIDRLSEVRDSVSGVNLDEEMTELMKIQRAYEAAAKLISITDEMLQALMQVR
jgi:flagellar hook-associated protein 1 FlgK